MHLIGVLVVRGQHVLALIRIQAQRLVAQHVPARLDGRCAGRACTRFSHRDRNTPMLRPYRGLVQRSNHLICFTCTTAAQELVRVSQLSGR